MSGKNIWDGYGRWDNVAKLEKIDDVKAMITGARLWRPNFVSPAVQHVFEYAIEEAEGVVATAADFGCGLGRNGPMLRRFFPRVVGVDLPDMIERVKAASPVFVEKTYSHLYSSVSDLIASENVCALYDSVVFQHIVDAEYVAGLVAELVKKPSLRTIVSVHYNADNAGTRPVAVNLLLERGWRIWHAEEDTLSFEGVAHTVLALRRW